ncbi:PPC domain-containing DNA-binding protein [Candidatus Altiarchaeota archaeon]
MEYKRFGNKIVARIDKGEEVIQELTKIIQAEDVKLGQITGIGATNQATIGLFNTTTKEYQATELNCDLEIAPLTGNITRKDSQPYIHIHANLADQQHKAYAGHLNKAVISGTLEAVITVIDAEVGRKFSEEVGLNLLEF